MDRPDSTYDMCMDAVDVPLAAGTRRRLRRLRVRLRAALRTAALLSVAGLFLLGCDLVSQYLLLPYWLEDLGRAFYKLFFFVTLPFRGVAVTLTPGVAHHWPLAHHVLTSMGTPFFLWAVWRVMRASAAVRRRRRAARRPARSPKAINRRQFLTRSAAGVVGFATGGVGGYASLVAPEHLRLRRYDIAIPDLPRALDGMRLAHIADTHYGPFVSMPYLEHVMQCANALKPDLMVLTGDYVHYTPDSVEPGIGVLERLCARWGAVAVMGNHEHWEGAERCREQFRRIGIPLVDNGRLFLTAEGLSDSARDGESLCLAGVGDLWEDEVSFEKALAGVGDSMPRLLLSHNPDVAERAAGYRVDLMLSGHTHGGQIALPLIGAPVSPSRFGDKYLGGLCQGPEYRVLVSRGVGLAGVPLRLGVPPELSLVTLHRV